MTRWAMVFNLDRCIGNFMEVLTRYRIPPRRVCTPSMRLTLRYRMLPCLQQRSADPTQKRLTEVTFLC